MQSEREDELVAVAAMASGYLHGRAQDAVSQPVDRGHLDERLAAFDFDHPIATPQAAGLLLELLRSTGVRSDHPRYFGLFNPPALIPAVAGDLVAAVANPQLAVWGHAPTAVEIERRLVQLFTQEIWPGAPSGGSFTSGGSEANHTAVLAALGRAYPEWATAGLRALPRQPLIYVSSEAHLAWIKIARAVGLGSDAVRLVAPADGLSLEGETLRAAMEQDAKGQPLMVVATAGATAHGAIDDLYGVARAGRKVGAYVHVDAAWAGGALLAPDRRGLLAGLDAADSVTIDPHKWLGVPMGAGLFLTRDAALLRAPFAVSTGYMPPTSEDRPDPYLNSLQWSRRFIGAKLFMALAVLGRAGYAAMIERQFALGERLRDALADSGWQILNATPLPLVCFAPADGGEDEVRRIERAVVASGEAWLSTVRLRSRLCLRACVTSFETREADIDRLIELLDEARQG